MPREITKEEREALLKEVEFVTKNRNTDVSPVCRGRACSSCLYKLWLGETCAIRVNGPVEHQRRIAQAQQLVQMAGLEKPEKPKRFRFNEGGMKRVFVVLNHYLRVSCRGEYMQPYTGQYFRMTCHVLDTQDCVVKFSQLAAAYVEARNAQTS